MAHKLVTIYEDPITRKIEEGQARLIRKVAAVNDDGYEQWDVEFDDGYDLCLRTIHTSQRAS
jgi:hypothetical protein